MKLLLLGSYAGFEMGAPDLQTASVVERLQELDGLALIGVRCDVHDELDDRLIVTRAADSWGSVLDRIIRPWEDAAIDMRVREDLRIEQVQQCHRCGVAALLHDRSLENLHLATEETELARHRESECFDGAARLEIIPERVVGHVEIRFGEISAIARLGRRRVRCRLGLWGRSRIWRHGLRRHGTNADGVRRIHG